MAYLRELRFVGMSHSFTGSVSMATMPVLPLTSGVVEFSKSTSGGASESVSSSASSSVTASDITSATEFAATSARESATAAAFALESVTATLLSVLTVP